MTDIKHNDILNNPVNTGDIVVYPNRNRMSIGVVKKLNPKMINITPIGNSWIDRKYSSEVLVVDDPKISMYILKNSSC